MLWPVIQYTMCAQSHTRAYIMQSLTICTQALINASSLLTLPPKHMSIIYEHSHLKPLKSGETMVQGPTQLHSRCVSEPINYSPCASNIDKAIPISPIQMGHIFFALLSSKQDFVKDCIPYVILVILAN